MPPWEAQLACDVQPATLEWLWPGYLPRGKLTVLDGDPGLGKSLLTIDLAARLTTGRHLPDGQPVARSGNCILFSVEDGSADTVRPRLQAAGADLGRVVLPLFTDRLPRFPEDVPALAELIQSRGAELVVIDPLMAFLPPRVAANLDQCVRQALTPLAAVADRTGCAILMVRHLTKRNRTHAIRRGQGSMGIVAAVRSALIVTDRPGGLRVLAVAKSNVGDTPPALGYRIEANEADLPVVAWADRVDGTADELGLPVVSTEVKARDRAIDWLRRALAGGPRPAAEVRAAAAAAGIPERTLARAKAELPARSHRTFDYGKDVGCWYWYDPDAPWPKGAPFKKPFELPPLDPL